MNGTEQFKKTIKAYLDDLAKDDLFAVAYAKEGKNLEDCITYILNTVQKTKCKGFTDEEIFSIAVHYYDEENIDIGTAVDMRIVVNHTVELTEEEKQKEIAEAKKKVFDDAYSGMKTPSVRAKKKEEEVSLTLF